MITNGWRCPRDPCATFAPQAFLYEFRVSRRFLDGSCGWRYAFLLPFLRVTGSARGGPLYFGESELRALNRPGIAAGLTAPLLRSIHRRRYRPLQRAFGAPRSGQRVEEAELEAAFLARFCLAARFPNEPDLDSRKKRTPETASETRISHSPPGQLQLWPWLRQGILVLS